jgi:hypothetical protein
MISAVAYHEYTNTVENSNPRNFALWVEDAEINHPKPPEIRLIIHAIDNTNALDDGMSIA